MFATVSRPRFGFILLVVLSFFLAACGSSHRVACLGSGNCPCGTCPINPGPEFLYAVTTTGQISSFPVDHTSGALGTSSSVAGPAVTLGLAASGFQFLYASDFQSAQLFGYSINATSGVLTPISGSPFTTGQLSVPGGLATAPSGNFLYATDVGQVDIFSINATSGVPTAITPNQIRTNSGLQAAVSPSGTFLFATDIDPPNGVLAFTIDTTTGILAPVPGSPFSVPNQTVLNSQPLGIAVDPSGHFVYEALSATNQIAAWSINQTSGALTPVPGSPFSTGLLPSFLASASKFLYVMAGGAVNAYAIDPNSGVLTAVPGSPAFIGGIGGLAIDSTATHLYAAATAANSVFAFTIAADGSLTALAGSPFPATGPTLLVIVQMPGQGG